MDVQLDKIGTVLPVLHALLLKTGMLLLDHAAAQLDQIGMELVASVALEEESGMPLQIHVYAPQVIGMDFHVLHVLLVKPGVQQLYHALAQLILSGTD